MSSFRESYAHLSDGRPVYFFEEGAGPSLLFVHGAYHDADFARPMVEALRRRFRCISLDRVGYHRSGTLDRVTTLEEQVEAIAEVHSACTSEPLWVFGWSSGGNYAVAYAVAHPDRVCGLVLMEPALYAVFPTESRPPSVSTMVETVGPLLRAGRIDEGVEQSFRLFMPELSPEAVAEQSASALSSDDRGVVRAFATDQPLVVSWSPTPSGWARLAQPTLVIEGDLSWEWIRETAAKVTELLPNGELTTLKGCRHLAPLEAPNVVAQTTVEFINRIVASESEDSPTV